MSKGAGPALAAMLAAYLIWGGSGIFWKQVSHVDALDTLAHRFLWSLPLAALAVWWYRQGAELRELGRHPRQVLLLALTAFLMAATAGIFIWAVNQDRLVDASLGYFLSPLVSVVVGMLLLGEQLRRWQWVAVGLAATGVLAQITLFGDIPWAGIGVGLGFGAYGVLRKTCKLGSISGFLVEAALIAPIALFYAVWLHQAGTGAFGAIDRGTDLLLVATGAVTAVPMVLFVIGVRRISLTTTGLLFYLVPTGQFLVGVGIYGEPLTTGRLLAFSLVWIGLVIYTVESQMRAGRAAAPAIPPD